jgi:hypothetical protein
MLQSRRLWLWVLMRSLNFSNLPNPSFCTQYVKCWCWCWNQPQWSDGFIVVELNSSWYVEQQPFWFPNWRDQGQSYTKKECAVCLQRYLKFLLVTECLAYLKITAFTLGIICKPCFPFMQLAWNV